MSDPMSNVEIEDVLSSIRRLVSENAARPRPGSPAAPTEGTPEEAQGGGDALLLTPSQRVEEKAAEQSVEARPETADAAGVEAEDSDENALDASWQEVASPEKALWREPETFEFESGEDGSDAGAEHDTAEDAGQGDPLKSRVEGLEAAFDAGDEFEPDGSEMAQSDEAFDWEEGDGEETVIDLSTPDIPTGRLHFKGEPAEESPPEVIELGPPPEPRLEETAFDAEAEVPEEVAEEEEWPEPEEDWTAPDLPRPDDAPASAAPLVFRSAHRERPTQTPANDAAPLREEAASAESIDNIDEMDDEALAAYIDEAEEDGAEEEALHAQPEPPAEPAVEPVVEFRATEAKEEAEEAEAEAEAVAAEEDDEIFSAEVFDDEEDEALDGYVVGTEARHDDHDGAEEHDPWEDADAAEDVDGETGALPSATQEPLAPSVIDEEALTDLVAEVVREELRGRMGERITQNVRKLVRREIARALETRGIR